MYFKIESYHDSGMMVGDSPISDTPRTIHPRCFIYECLGVVVRKYEIRSYQEYCDFINPLLEVSHPPIEILGGTPEDGRSQELLDILLTSKDMTEQRVVAIDVNAYLMNADGKTIDRWSCTIFPYN